VSGPECLVHRKRAVDDQSSKLIDPRRRFMHASPVDPHAPQLLEIAVP
jgi:hypothetical protein